MGKLIEKSDINNILPFIKNSFIKYYDYNNIDKIEEIFNKLIVIGYRKNNKQINSKFNIEFCNKDMSNSIDEDQLVYIYNELRNRDTNLNTIAHAYLYTQNPTLAIRTDYNTQEYVGTLIHEISHLLMIEEIADIYDDNNNKIDVLKITSTSYGILSNYANEIINDGITLDVLSILNKDLDASYSYDSGYLSVDKILGYPGIRIYNMLRPYLKRFALNSAYTISHIVGNKNLIKYSFLFTEQKNKYKESKLKDENTYINEYFHNEDYINRKHACNKIVQSIKDRIYEYEKHNYDVQEYINLLESEGKITRLK